jgi:hypothetical protein
VSDRRVGPDSGRRQQNPLNSGPIAYALLGEGPPRNLDDRTTHATDHKEEENMHVELDGLSEAEIVRVGNYERCNKNRETLLEQIEPRACRVQRQPR